MGASTYAHQREERIQQVAGLIREQNEAAEYDAVLSRVVDPAARITVGLAEDRIRFPHRCGERLEFLFDVLQPLPISCQPCRTRLDPQRRPEKHKLRRVWKAQCIDELVVRRNAYQQGLSDDRGRAGSAVDWASILAA
jgi:hypothetical protein